MAARLRQFSVVIHDVPQEAKSLAQAVCQKLAVKYVIALEPYSHQAGFHIHIFYQCKSASNKDRELKRWQAFQWGRVQVDPMRGTFDQASVYVISPDKDKPTDPSPIRFPNQDAQYCSCNPGFLWSSELNAWHKIRKQIDQLKLKFGSIDFDDYEEQMDSLRRYLIRTFDHLMEYEFCKKCQTKTKFFHQAKIFG